jgi:predicted XRE-type DNA-binding protein
MAANIGDSYFLSIGRTFQSTRQNANVLRKPQRTFWERVQEALDDAGHPKTQGFVAGLLHVKQPSISDWNKAGGYPTMENAVKLAQKLNVCVEWLYTERGPKRPVPVEEGAQRLWDAWHKLDDLTKGELIGLAVAKAQANTLERSRGSSDSATELQRPPGRSGASRP